MMCRVLNKEGLCEYSDAFNACGPMDLKKKKLMDSIRFLNFNAKTALTLSSLSFYFL